MFLPFALHEKGQNSSIALLVRSQESKLMGWFGPNMGDYAMDLLGQISNIVMTSDNIR
jgi:hypothetical protein